MTYYNQKRFLCSYITDLDFFKCPNNWIYIPESKVWWRTFGSYEYKNDPVFLHKPPSCERCSFFCDKAIKYKDKLLCTQCYIPLRHVGFNLIKYLKKRELGIR